MPNPPNPVVVDTIIDLSALPPSVSLYVLVRAENITPPRCAYGIWRFHKGKYDGTIVNFPDDDQAGGLHRLGRVSAMQGRDIDCFGRVFPGTTTTVRVWNEFFADGELVATTYQAQSILTQNNPVMDFHLRTSFK